MANEEITAVNAEAISKVTGFSAEEIKIVKNNIAKGTTDKELSYYLSICKAVDLNPMLKQIWCYKNSNGDLLIFTGRDGFLAIAQRDKRWNGMLSAYVCANDIFDMDVAKGIVNHKPNFKDRGAIIGAYAIVKPKCCELPTVEWADFKTYNKGWNTWKTNPQDMIQKTAEAHALKKGFGISGLQSDYDFAVVDNIAVPVSEVITVDELTESKKKIIDALSIYQGEDKDIIQKMCADKVKANEFDMVFARETAKTLGIEL